MPGLQNQVWVTSVLGNDDVAKALSLCFSVRRAYTTRKFAVIVSPKVKPEMRQILNHAMDFVFYTEEHWDCGRLNMEILTKIYSLSALRAFEKCVYVAPTMLALQNCDDIFAKPIEAFMFPEGNSEDTSLFLFRPSRDNYKTSLESNGSIVSAGLKKWITNQLNIRDTIPSKYCKNLSVAEPLLGYEHEISMVNLLDYPDDSNIPILQTSGSLGRVVIDYWLKIQREDVLPMITSIAGIPQSIKTDRVSISSNISSLRKEPVAIVGMSCRYPGSNNLEEFWNILSQGADATGNPPAFRWQYGNAQPADSDARKTNAGFLKTQVDEFDAKFFGISPKEAESMDPQHRLLHELVWESLEDACVNPQTLRGTSGSIFMGSWRYDYQEIQRNAEDSEFYRSYMGNSIGAAAARISFLLGMTGPCVSTESGCSSAMVAVHMACQALSLGHTNIALACGVNLLLKPFAKEELPVMFSPDGVCKTFSEDANGFGRAEGGGVLVLKRLSDALKDGDNIWGLIRGSAISQEGISKSMGTPTVYCESLAMKGALYDANVSPDQVSYVEAHGTGTVVGDPMEVTAIAEAYHSPKRTEPLVIGSVKTNVGHTESCSGITGIMKVILAMKYQLIPAHRNFTKLNPSIDLNAVPAVIPLNSMEWKLVPGKPRLAGVSSFGITGTDGHVIIEEPPQAMVTRSALSMDEYLLERPQHIMKLSAKTEDAMDMLLSKYGELLQISDKAIADVAFSANTGRANFPIRIAIVGKNKEDFVKKIEEQKFAKGDGGSENMGKICFLFTGQGSQYFGMAKSLFDTSPVFRLHFEHCCKLLKELYGISFLDILWQNNSLNHDEIHRTIYSQTSIFCVEYAILKLWESWGVKPNFVLGHSLGEFCAAVAAGILSLEDAIKLVAVRTRLIEKLPHGKMLVIRADQQQVEKMMKKFAGKREAKLLDFAAINSSDQTVISGDSEVILEFSAFCSEMKLKCIILGSTHAFHSRHMNPILDEYRNFARTIQSSTQKCEYISGMKGDLIAGNTIDAEYWVQHTREKVDFLKASKKAVQLGCTLFLEIGPQPILSALTVINNDMTLTCLPSLKKTEEAWTTMLTSLGKLYVKGVEIDWTGVDQFRNRCKVRLPNYPFFGKKFWPDLLHSTGNKIHPLIGSVIPNASTTKIFQNELTLKNLEWVKDHVIGNTVIFPGACYLEMCLAAGLASIEGSLISFYKPSRAMKIENLVIQAPFALDKSNKTNQLQSIVEFNSTTENSQDWDNISVKIFRRMESDKEEKWLPQAKAKFSPLVTSEERDLYASEIPKITALVTNSPESNELSLWYQKLSSVGLKFGPAFKHLEKLWRNDDGTSLFQLKVPPVSDAITSTYILHPAIMDAMIQAIMVPPLVTDMKKKLQVPVKIGNFCWFSEGANTERFIYVFNNKRVGHTPTALLLDSDGTILAAMTNVELVATTAKTIEHVIEQENFTMPQIWEEIWRPHIGPIQFSHDSILCAQQSFASQDFFNHIVHTYNQPSPEAEVIFSKLEKLAYYNMLRGLYQCGFEATNQIINENKLREELKIQKKFAKLFAFYLQCFQEEGILEKIGPKSWKIIKNPPNLDEIEKELASPDFNEILESSFKSARLFIQVGEILSKILQGETLALDILFPANENKTCGSSPVANFYFEYGKLSKIYNMASTVVETFLKQCKRHQQSDGKRSILRICEVGAGTGTASVGFLELLAELGFEYEYTYTDISTSFFPNTDKRFEKYLNNIIFKKLNIEKDPITQGFVPAYYDLVFAFDVIHATKNVKATLQNLKLILKPEGRLDILEITGGNRIGTYLFGLLDGFWLFEDFDIRPNQCTLSADGWKNILQASGFSVIKSYPCLSHSYICSKRMIQDVDETKETEDKIFDVGSNSPTWILFHHAESKMSNEILQKISHLTNREIVIVEQNSKYQRFVDRGVPRFTVRIDTENDYVEVMQSVESEGNLSVEGVIYCWSLEGGYVKQERIIKPFFHMCKSVLGMKKGAELKMVVLTKGIAPVEGNSLDNYHSSTILGFIKSLQSESLSLKCRCIDIGDSEQTDGGAMQIFHEIWNPRAEIQVAYYKNTRYVPKYVSLKYSQQDLEIPSGCNEFQLILPKSKSIADLEFGPLERVTLGMKEIEIEVKCSALNFRDVLSVLKPSERFKDMNAVGVDFAGVVKRVHPHVRKWQVGDQVFGANMNGIALPSHMKLQEDDVLPVPNDMTLEEASTIPVVVATSYHCLVEVANVKSADIVLIHTASGGVGLSAIEICKHYGATIIATAGSQRKKNYLKSIGIEHVFHSRDTQYSDEILRVTNGRGVDVVLNSLTSKGFKEATLRACAPGARFVEMSKLSIWKPEDVQNKRPDVQYTVVDVSAMDGTKWRQLLTRINALVISKVVTPIPFVRFNGVNIREALQYLQGAKHIGKVVCVMPEIRRLNGQREVWTPMFSSNSTYLITGGLGGIGLEVCKWMVKSGAKHVLLVGRSLPSPKVRDIIADLNSKDGAKIRAFQLDVSNLDQCKKLLDLLQQIDNPPLRGIMHAAGTLHDGLIKNQTWDTFSSTFNAKIQGTLNLHEVTKNGHNLEHFVMFSSSASACGALGQSNHAAANQFEDTFAHYRRSVGMPATSINWGAWGESGVAAEIDFPGGKALTNAQGIAALEYVLKSQRTQTACMNIESFLLLKKVYPFIYSYFDERVIKTCTTFTSAGLTHLSSEQFWQQYEGCGSVEEKQDVLKGKLQIILGNNLNLEQSDKIADTTDLQEIGVDSLMFVEIGNSLQTLLRNKYILNTNILKDCNTINLMARNVVKAIEGDDDLTEIIPTSEEVCQLIKEDCVVAEEIRAQPDQICIKSSEISTVLLTGVTGMLGPYVLRELCNHKQITQVICLIRSNKNLTTEERLICTLKEREQLTNIDMSKVICVDGNVAMPHLGMDDKTWTNLSDSVDAVVHLASLVQHLEFYVKTKHPTSMRATNIGGLKKVLEFCCTGTKLKHIYCASSIAGVSTINEEGNISESWPEVDDYNGVTNFAYPITKFVGDVVMKEAVSKRGIPGKVFRFSFISGDSKTGRFVLDQNHLMLRLIFMMQNGIMPNNPFPLSALPVDICAKLSVDLFLDPNVPNDVYNIANAIPDAEQNFVELAKRLKHCIKIVDQAEFERIVLKSTSDNSALSSFKDVYTNGRFVSVYSTNKVLQKWVMDVGGKEDYFASRKLAKLIPGFYSSPLGTTPSSEYIYKDLLYAKDNGWLKKFGL